MKLQYEEEAGPKKTLNVAMGGGVYIFQVSLQLHLVSINMKWRDITVL